ncbi:MAG: sugar phosphate isomerase/epimerase [Armatimonadetes bacterium]|jgi:inosose dehydratase|nr:sugar phosphate isomerase/epimerase [Armatimonadota bacterium]MDI9586093.1 sugar phosphate isomerase/epimerase [Acidobacteriota bacterium]
MPLLTGTQLYGWGQVYARDGQRIEDHYEEVLATVRDIGMDTAERVLGDLDAAGVRAWADLLRANDLAPASLYAGGALHETEAARRTCDHLIALAPTLVEAGFRVLNVNPDPIGREKTADELTIQAAAIQRLGEGLRSEGIALGLHNHTPEMVNAAREFHHNLRNTSAEAVGLCMDWHWCWRGGSDPWELWETYGNRVVSFHLRQSRDGIWTEAFEDGDLDYRPLIHQLVQRDFSGPVLLELALEDGTPQTRTAAENHRLSFEYLRSLLP